MRWICAAGFMLIALAAQAEVVRTELKRSGLTGTDMEVIMTVVEVKPGDTLGRHIHPGEEAIYVLDGATLEFPDGTQRPYPTGATTINARAVPHAGFKVAGDKPLKLLTVHIVDKGKPPTELVK